MDGLKSSSVYGHACSNCVKTKCKCVRREGGTCERCNRLGKDCSPATFVRKRGARNNAASCRTSKLEDKLESLVSLLQAQHVPIQKTTAAANLIVPAELTTKNQPINPSQEVLSRVADLPHLDTAAVTVPTPTSNITTLRSSTSYPALHDADQVLNIFRNRFLKQFPFMHIPEDMSVEQFRRDRPVTFKCIMVACEPSLAKQREARKVVREEISRRIVVESERSIDLLLATMICIIWQIYFTQLQTRTDLCMMSTICRTMINDMRLVRNPYPGPQTCPKVPSLYELPDFGEIRTDEERRALLAYYAVSSMLFTCYKHEPWRWSPMLEEFCQKLALNHSIPGDQILIAIVRISRVSNEAAEILQRLCEHPENAAHGMFQIKTLQYLHEQTKTSLGKELLQEKLVLCYLNCNSIAIHELALFQPPASRFRDPITSQRTTFLTFCLHACKSALDNFNSMNASHMNSASFLSWSYSISILFKLSVLEHPGWDRQLVRSTCDVLEYFAKAANLSKSIDQELKQLTGMPENVFSRVSDIFGSRMEIWREYLERYGGASVGTEGVASLSSDAAGLDAFGSGFDLIDQSWFDFADDPLFSGIFTP